jgi:hypothetical protein
MDFFAGVVAGYVVSGAALFVALGVGAVVGVLVVCFFGARHDDRCAETGCVRRVR